MNKTDSDETTNNTSSNPSEVIPSSSVWIWISVGFIVVIAIAVIMVLVWYFESHHSSSSTSTPVVTSSGSTGTKTITTTTPPVTTDSTYAFQDTFDSLNNANWNLVTDGSGDNDDECQFYVPINVAKNSTGGIALIVNPIVNSQGTNVTALASYRYTNPISNIVSQRYYLGGKMTTQGHFGFQYGRVDVMAQTPSQFVSFICPAISLVSFKQLESSVNLWPTLGQIDLMNIFGLIYGDQTICSTVWYGGNVGGANPSGYSFVQSQFHMPATPNNMHVFSVLWQPGVLTFLCDNFLYATVTPTTTTNNGVTSPNTNANNPNTIWPFDMTNNFFCLSIKNGIGGNLSCPSGTNVPPLDQLINNKGQNINPLVGNYLTQQPEAFVVMSVTVTPNAFTILQPSQ